VLALPAERIAGFCQRWKIDELSLFGSALREDFGPQSDLDLLVNYAKDSQWGLWDHVQMQQELEMIVGRHVDLISKRAVERSGNRLRRDEILTNVRVVYSATEATHALCVPLRPAVNHRLEIVLTSSPASRPLRSP
jgi:predicted nucleotidyltransferase